MRVFVAIGLPEEVLDALERLQDDLPVGRHMARETLHLTLAFLGEQDGAAVEAVHDELSRLSNFAFDLSLQGVGTFGGRAPQILWAGVGVTPQLVALRDGVRRAVRRAGVELARERFRPHVTIARFRHRLHGDEIERIAGFLERNGGFAAGPFRVERVMLFRSRLHSDGAVHEVLADYGLGG